MEHLENIAFVLFALICLTEWGDVKEYFKNRWS